MSNKILKLPESLIRLIAAGEVIERPASVVKELVENSLDAGATQIAIDIWGAGRTRIRVADNGEGMTPEDAELALDRHATSKLRSFDDLQQLATFGFRGEALPSIAAVSQLELTTRTRNASEAFRIKLVGGKVLSRSKAGVPRGTTLDVQDLFFNTPARSKFMKRDGTERSHILRVIEEIAMAHPSVGFQVTVEDKKVLSLPPVPEFRLRLADLWESAVMDTLVEISFQQGPLMLKGLINKVPAHAATKAYQHLFVNNRPVQQRLLTHAIYEAYHEWLPVGRHPAFVLFMQVDPAAIDVNVHPSKREVRFSNERILYDLFFYQIRKLLQERKDMPVLGEAGHRAAGAAEQPLFTDSSPSRTANISDTSYAAVVSDAPMPRVPDTPPSFANASIRLLGQFQKLYLIAEQGQELLLIDQHAAAERVLYERLLKQAQAPSTATQPLLSPYVWELTADRAEIVRDAQPALQKLGFGIEAFGANTFVVKELPASFPQLRHAKRFLEIFLDSISSEARDSQENAQHEAVARAACRAAIKANDSVAPEEMLQLLKDLASCERPMTCPHGRPTYIRLPISELHRRFRRT